MATLRNLRFLRQGHYIQPIRVVYLTNGLGSNPPFKVSVWTTLQERYSSD